jgi:3-oxoacyl-[acyl-carrier protein] reductase
MGSNMNGLEIRGKSVLITGGCGGIGLGIATAFANRGLSVLLADRDVSGADALCSANPNVRCIEVDLGNSAAIDAALKPLLTGNDAPDILVNGVGISPKYSPSGERWTAWTMPLDHWQDILRVDLDSIFYTSSLILPKMIERRAGRIINIASLVSRTSGGGVAPIHYVTAKTALLGLTRVTAQEVGPHGITVNAVSPGRIDTPMIRDVPDKVNQSIARSIPLKRLGTPKDVAGAIVFLASELADYLTGVVIDVNGGMYMA